MEVVDNTSSSQIKGWMKAQYTGTLDTINLLVMHTCVHIMYIFAQLTLYTKLTTLPVDVALFAAPTIDCCVRATAEVDGGQKRWSGCRGAVIPSLVQKEQPNFPLNCFMFSTMARAGKSNVEISSMHRSFMGPSGVDTSIPRKTASGMWNQLSAP